MINQTSAPLAIRQRVFAYFFFPYFAQGLLAHNLLRFRFVKNIVLGLGGISCSNEEITEVIASFEKKAGVVSKVDRLKALFLGQPESAEAM